MKELIEHMPLHLLLAVCKSIQSYQEIGDYSTDDAFPLFLRGTHAEDCESEVRELILERARREFGSIENLLAHKNENT